MDRADIENRFTYHPPQGDEVREYEIIRANARRFAHSLNITLPESREKSTAITKLEEVVFWANAAIARHGIRNG